MTALGKTSFRFDGKVFSAPGCVTAFREGPSFCALLHELLASLRRLDHLNTISAIKAGST